MSADISQSFGGHHDSCQVSQMRLSVHSLESLLQDVADLTKTTLSEPCEVSATLLVGNRVHNAAHTGELARDLDAVQLSTGSGPTLDAISTGQLVHVADMASEARWVGFVQAAISCGVVSTVSVPISADAHPKVSAALNAYSVRPHAFDPSTLPLVASHARGAETMILNAHEHETCRELVCQLATALETRPVIDQAKGILMRDRACTAEEAFALLEAASKRSNVKVRDLARKMVESVTQGQSLPQQ